MRRKHQYFHSFIISPLLNSYFSTIAITSLQRVKPVHLRLCCGGVRTSVQTCMCSKVFAPWPVDTTALSSPTSELCRGTRSTPQHSRPQALLNISILGGGGGHSNWEEALLTRVPPTGKASCSPGDVPASVLRGRKEGGQRHSTRAGLPPRPVTHKRLPKPPSLGAPDAV